MLGEWVRGEREACGDWGKVGDTDLGDSDRDIDRGDNDLDIDLDDLGDNDLETDLRDLGDDLFVRRRGDRW